ncbi:unnamed protein product, partial [Mesorhabditis belari]|uniref:DUF7758 domain-containing protein n=1 Tax=Mesorhabditis belari TaxID=2138241 RepID=A0AAF3EL93_9BILA
MMQKVKPLDEEPTQQPSTSKELQAKHGFFRRKWRKARSEMINAFLARYRRCVFSLKKCLRENSEADYQRRRSQAKLTPLPDKKIRRVTTNLKRTPTNELEKLRKKGDDWTANDLFRFQYSDPEEGTPEERRILCLEWLDRLQKIQKKFCYLAWFASAIHACYYRLAPLLKDVDERKKYWEEVKREYAEIFLMGRRIWRRPTHPSRLRVFYDLAMLCTRFGEVPHDRTIVCFRDLLSDHDNFDFKVLSEVQYANSIDKVVRLENHVIDQFYSRRRSTGSRCSSARSRSFRSDASPNRDGSDRESRRTSECIESFKESHMKEARDRVRARSNQMNRDMKQSEEELLEIVDHKEQEDLSRETLPDEFVMLSLDPLQEESESSEAQKVAEQNENQRKERPKSILVPTIIVEGPEGYYLTRRGSSRRNSQTSRPASPKQIVRFEGAS